MTSKIKNFWSCWSSLKFVTCMRIWGMQYRICCQTGWCNVHISLFPDMFYLFRRWGGRDSIRNFHFLVLFALKKDVYFFNVAPTYVGSFYWKQNTKKRRQKHSCTSRHLWNKKRVLVLVYNFSNALWYAQRNFTKRDVIVSVFVFKHFFSLYKFFFSSAPKSKN